MFSHLNISVTFYQWTIVTCVCAIQGQVSHWLQPDLIWFTSIDKQLLHSGACEHCGQRRHCGPCGPTSGMKYRKTQPGCFKMTENYLWVCAYNEWKKSNITYGGGHWEAPGWNVWAEYEADLHCEHQKRAKDFIKTKKTLCSTYFHKLIIQEIIGNCNVYV